MSLQKTLNKSLLLPIASLILVAVVVVGVASYHSANSALETRTQDLAESSSVLFKDLLWQLDYETLQVLLDGYVALGLVTAAEIRSGPRFKAAAGSVEPGESVYILKRELKYSRADTGRRSAKLMLTASRASVWPQVLRRVIGTLFIATLAVMATTFIIQYLLTKRLILPVRDIANGLDNWRGNWRDFRLDLQRTGRSEKDADDELDRLVRSIHGMRDHMLEADSIIESKEVRLLAAAQIAGIGYVSYQFESGQIIECDDNFAGMLGSTVEKMLGMSIRDDFLSKRLHPDDLAQRAHIYQQLLLDNACEAVFRLARDSGEYRHIRQLFDIAPGRVGNTFVVRAVAQDVTELNRLQSSLVQAQKNKAIGNLTGGVAHDVNNILAVISGNLELLDSTLSDPAAHKYVETSQRAVDLGAELTHQLLAFARKQPLRPVVLDLSRVIRDSLSLLRTSVGESVDLEVVSDAGLWLTEVDKIQLETAMLNLVINARDAMPEGGKLTIEVGNARLDREYASMHEEVRAGQYVCIAITDTGCGMDAATITQATEPFFTTKELGSGTGLGLPMAYGFIKQSGGHLKIYSEPSRGTTVKIYLPRVDAPQDVVRSEKAGPSAAPFHGIQVFLVEDDEELRKTFIMQLEQMGSAVHSAPDGKTAFEMAYSIPHIDLILCDVILPNGMKGPDVVAGLQLGYPDARVIYMSGYTENAIIHQGRLDNGVIMLQKPFSRRDLLAAYAAALQEHKQLEDA